MSFAVGRGRYRTLTYPVRNAGIASVAASAVERIGSGNGSGTTLISLDTTDLADGDTVFVDREGTFFELVVDPNVALIAATDGITVVAPTTPVGSEVWVRRTGQSLRFAYETVWFVDAAAGDDDNDGLTAPTALATVGELCRRLSGLRIPQSVTVTFTAGDYSASTLALQLELPQGVSMLLQGAVTSISDTIAVILPTVSGTAETNAGAQRGTVTATSASFTDRQRLRITSGAASGAVAWVTRVVTPGAGGAANVSRWGTMTPTTGTLVTNQTPSAGVTYALDTLDTTIGAIDVQVRGQGRVVFADCRVQPAGTSTWSYKASGTNGNVNGVLFYRCSLGSAATTVLLECLCTFALCSFSSNLASVGRIVFSGGFVSVRMCTFTGTAAVPRTVVQIQNHVTVQQDSGVCFDDAQVVIEQGGLWDQIGNSGNDVQWVDGTQTHACEVTPTGTWWNHSITNLVWGLDNAWTGITFLIAGRFYYNPKPSVPGGTSDVSVGGTTGAYAALPIFDVTPPGAGALMSN